jgi:hypothetical protein
MKTTEGNAVVTRVTTTSDESPQSHTLTRLDSWKDIAHYLNRNVRTVQRWEMLEAMPVHRHGHDTGHSVYAYKQEIDAWRLNRSHEKRPTLRFSAIRRTRLGSLVGVEQSALLRLFEVIAEHLHVDLAQSTAGLPADDSLGQGAATAWSSLKTANGPRPADHMTIRDTIETRSLSLAED